MANKTKIHAGTLGYICKDRPVHSRWRPVSQAGVFHLLFIDHIIGYNTKQIGPSIQRKIRKEFNNTNLSLTVERPSSRRTFLSELFPENRTTSCNTSLGSAHLKRIESTPELCQHRFLRFSTAGTYTVSWQTNKSNPARAQRHREQHQLVTRIV